MNRVMGALIVIVVSSLLVSVGEKKQKLKKGSLLYKVLVIGGQVLGSIVMITSYAYVKTDTTLEWLLVTLLFGILMGDIAFLNDRVEKQKNIGVVIPISISVMFLISYAVSRYSLEQIPIAVLGAIMGVHMGIVNRSIEAGIGHPKLLKIEMLFLLISLLVCCLGIDEVMGPLDKPRRMISNSLRTEVQQGKIGSYEIIYLPGQKLERNKVLKLKVLKQDVEGILKEVVYYEYFGDKLQVTDMNWD